MVDNKKRSRQATKRSVSGSPILAEAINDPVYQYAGDLADDHDFLAPHDLCQNAIGLLFCLTTKRLTGTSFSTLYHRSQKRSWLDLLICERRNLKPNVNSIEKCFTLNRLIAACAKNPIEFAEQTTRLYEEIQMGMTSTETLFLTTENLFEAIRTYRNKQYQQRLFYTNHEKTKPPQTLISLQRATTEMYSQVIHSVDTDGGDQLKKLLQHSFMIVDEPSIPECVAATKYEKLGNTYTIKLNSRILCLLDVDTIEKHFTLSNIAVTLYALDRQLDEEGEMQSVLEWKTCRLIDGQGLPRLFYYAEVHSLKLTKLDLRSLRPLYGSKLCQLQFEFKMKNCTIEENIIILSRPFGLCSHSQYFPEYVAKALIYEIEQIPQNTDHILHPSTITDFICRYYTRATGVKPKAYTRKTILQELQAAYEAKKNNNGFTSVHIYEGILSKLISQIDFLVDHPYLSMMYEDGLFLGVCDSTIDNEMTGTEEEPLVLLRFDRLTEHQASQQASIRYIVHNGQLIKATFHSKAFVDEMCRMICESNSKKAKTSRMLSDTPNRLFHDFTLYFDNDLYRLSTISPPTKEAYKPLIPVLWSTMRSTTGTQIKQIANSPSSDMESAAVSTSPKNQIEKNLSDMNETTDTTLITIEKFSVQTETFIRYLAEKLPEMLLKLQIPVSYPIASTISPDEIIKQNHSIVSNLLRDYIQTLSRVQASTQVINKQNHRQSYTSFCSTPTDE